MQFRSLAFFGAIWASLVVIGQGWLLEKSNEGSPARAEVSWPQDSGLQLAADKFTLLFFAHPKCACTQASLYELDRLMTRHVNKLTGYIAFASAREFEPEFSKGKNALWNQATRIDSLTTFCDRDNEESRRFRANVSGTVVVFSPDKQLCFAGGLTASKGHCGISAGIQAIDLILSQPTTDVIRTPVYGCGLVAPTTEREL